MSLVGNQVKNSFRSILNMPNNDDGLLAGLQSVVDGDNNSCPLQLSFTQVNITQGFSVEGVGITTQGASDGQLFRYNSSLNRFEPSDIISGGTF